jgi:hypothetical protein
VRWPTAIVSLRTAIIELRAKTYEVRLRLFGGAGGCIPRAKSQDLGLSFEREKSEVGRRDLGEVGN